MATTKIKHTVGLEKIRQELTKLKGLGYELRLIDCISTNNRTDLEILVNLGGRAQERRTYRATEHGGYKYVKRTEKHWITL